MLNFIPQDWIIGLLGLIPIFLGIRVALVGEEEEEEEEVVEKLESRGTNRFFWTVALITIASGGDNLGIYIPYFASLSFSEIVTALIVFAISVAVLCYISYKLAKISFVSETLEKYERILVSYSVYWLRNLYIDRKWYDSNCIEFYLINYNSLIVSTKKDSEIKTRCLFLFVLTDCKIILTFVVCLYFSFLFFI